MGQERLNHLVMIFIKNKVAADLNNEDYATELFSLESSKSTIFMINYL